MSSTSATTTITTTTSTTTTGISGTTTTTASVNTNVNTNSPTNTLTPPIFPANLAKIVNIIESNVKDTEPSGQVASSTSAGIHTTIAAVTAASSGHNTPRHYVPKTPLIDEIVFTEPTFMERFARYLVVVIYLCGLCSIGFVLSIYHFFFWDSRMPPVYKGQKKPAFG